VRKNDTFFVLDLGLDIVDGVAALDLESDGLAGQGFHEDLHLLCFVSLLPILAKPPIRAIVNHWLARRIFKIPINSCGNRRVVC
jgi:hypothetical protein